MIHPIIDEFYNQSPSYIRSSKLVRDKGQMTTNAMINKKNPNLPSPNARNMAGVTLVDHVATELEKLKTEQTHETC